MNNKGLEFEDYISRRIGKTEEHASTTIRSGGVHDDEDVKTRNYLIQCKYDERRDNFIITKKDWDKLSSNVIKNPNQDGNYRTGIFAVKNKSRDIIVAISLEDFLAMVEKINHKEDNNEE